MINKSAIFFTSLIILALAISILPAQTDEAVQKRLKLNRSELKDSILKSTRIILNDSTMTDLDSGAISEESFTVTKKNKTGIDTTVFYYARDSVRFRVKDQVLRLRGNSKLNLRSQKLEAEIIELRFKNSTLDASGVVDSSGRWIGFPKFQDMGEEFAGERILYNFKSSQGTITLGETEMSEGFYFGTKIKRVSQTESFIQKGYYTTCDAPEPHFHFGSPEMKFIAGDRVFLDPLIFYVEDLPLFMLPFGLFFPSQGGRQSGFMIPSFFFSKNRGVTFEDFGFYFALSDYYDTEISAKYYSKGGFNIKNFTRWNWLNHFSGNMEISYGKTRLNTDQPYAQDWNIRLNHNQSINPQERIDINLNLSSNDFFRNTSSNISDRVTQKMSSRASYSKSFDNKSNFSISYDREQDILDNSYSQNIPIRFSLPSYNPFRNITSQGSVLQDFTFGYSVNAQYNSANVVKSGTFDSDTSKKQFVFTETKKIMHSPSISISPKFGYFTLQPSVSFYANNYFRRLTRRFDTKDSVAVDSFEQGFFTEYNYSMSLRLSTKLFGILSAQMLGTDKIAGIRAFRHTYQPSFGYSYSPDLSDPNLGFWDKYYDEKQKIYYQYSRFAADNGGIASQSLSSMLNYSDVHTFDIKIASKDTTPDVNLELLRITNSLGYNMAADSLRLSNLNTSINSKALGFLDFNGSANFSFYDEDFKLDTIAGKERKSYYKVNRYLFSEGKGLARLTSFNLQLSANFNSQGISIGTPSTPSADTTDVHKDSISLGERFRIRQESHEQQADIFGENTPGYNPVSMPWNLGIGLNYGYSQPSLNVISRSLIVNANFSFSLTPSWKISSGAQYDFINDNLLIPTVSITKDIHCWALSVRWTPTGYNQGFHLQFGVKASHLKDLQIEKQSSPLLR